MSRLRGGIALATLLAACGGAAGGPGGGASPGAARGGARAAPEPRAAPVLGPARYALTDRAGTTFDDAGRGAPVPRREPALYEGARLLLEGGVIVASAASPEPITGFTSVPPRLGGGFLLWSSRRLYRAADFLGPLALIAGVSVRAADPWLDAMALRTERGLLLLDPAAAAPALRRFTEPGIMDAVALDARRGVRLDALGRAAVTLDGGATWTDVLATRGVHVTGIFLADDRVKFMGSGERPPLAFGAAGLVEAPRDAGTARRFNPENNQQVPQPSPAPLTMSSRMLAPEALARAAAAGVLLPGGRILVARSEGLSLLSGVTAWPILEGAPLGVGSDYVRCQALLDGGAAPLLACSHAAAHVLRLDAALTRPALEATFPERGRFFSGAGRGLALAGRCGRRPPSADDFLHGPPPPIEEEDPRYPPAVVQNPSGTSSPEPEAPPDPLPEDDARVCLREADGRWIERRLLGDDARRLHRWIPGPGRVTALVALGGGDGDGGRGGDGDRGGGARGSAPPPPPAGIRVVRVRPDDPALRGGRFPAILDPERSERMVDADFWEDEDGAIRGWILLPAEAEGEGSGARNTEEQPSGDSPGASAGKLPISNRRGGRAAGVRIDAAGQVTVLPLPEGVVEVVYGGPFALARTEASEEKPPRYFESTDGGRTWRPVEGPPVGRLEPPSDEWSAFACSPVGCALNDAGLVRLGWGGPAPREPEAPPAGGAAPEPPPPPSARLSCRIEGGSPPPRRKPLVAVPPAPIATLAGGSYRIDATAPLPGGGVLALDTFKSALLLIGADGARVAMKLNAVGGPPSTRLTLGQRMDGRGLAIVGYVTSSGDFFSGALDLGKAEVAPLQALGALDALAAPDMKDACKPGPGAVRFVAEIPLAVRLEAADGQELLDEQLEARALIAGGGGRLCVEGVEAGARARGGIAIRAAFGPGEAATVRGAGASDAAAHCDLTPPARR